MKQGTAPLHIDKQGCHVTLDNIPAWVCEQCGEAYFEELKATQDRTPALGRCVGGAGELSLRGNHINIVRPDFHLRVSVILKEQLSIYRELRINHQLHYMRR
jgi:YgiT-type zinc finger domain-containing protein